MSVPDPIAGAIPSERSVTIHWPDGRTSQEVCGRDWLAAAHAAGQTIPTGCLGGSCGACEIEVNGQVVRACVATVPASRQGVLRVELAGDPYW
jgi:ferredoxin